jgi:hypothetical protein
MLTPGNCNVKDKYHYDRRKVPCLPLRAQSTMGPTGRRNTNIFCVFSNLTSHLNIEISCIIIIFTNVF